MPKPPPRSLIRYVEITDSGGQCAGANIYSPQAADIKCIEPPYRDLMTRQVIINIAGGVGEAVYRGERRRSCVYDFMKEHCGVGTDIKHAHATMAHLYFLDKKWPDEQMLVDRTMTMLLQEWGAVCALADALVEERRISGDRVERIIDQA